MKKIIFILLFTCSAITISLAQESVATSGDSSQVEFYSSMEDYLTKNIIPSVHITILAVTDVHRLFGGTVDFKVENFPGKKEKEDYSEEPLPMIL